MVSLRKLKKLFRRDSAAHMHPSKKGDEPIACQRMEKILRERSVTSKPFHVKVRVQILITYMDKLHV